jgi:hypothetical protein
MMVSRMKRGRNKIGVFGRSLDGICSVWKSESDKIKISD